MRIPGLKTVKQTALWLKNKTFPGALILGYHRVARVENDSFYNCTAPSHFAQQMEVLKNYANPISMDELVACLNTREPPPKTVCVTIDDGYVDTLYSAKPILEKFEIPATVFVTTGNLGGEFWWDELERYILSAPEDAGLLHLKKGKLDLEWDFKGLEPAKRAGKISAIADFLRPLDAANRRLLLNKIKEWSGNNHPGELPLARSLTANELVSLIDGELIQVGSHTVTHPVLAELSEQERWYEINESKHELEKFLAKPVHGFSYPNGQFSKGDPELVSKAGYQYACMSNNGTVRSNSDRFRLPRFWIGDIAGDTFQRWLKGWIVS